MECFSEPGESSLQPQRYWGQPQAKEGLEVTRLYDYFDQPGQRLHLRPHIHTNDRTVFVVGGADETILMLYRRYYIHVTGLLRGEPYERRVLPVRPVSVPDIVIGKRWSVSTLLGNTPATPQAVWRIGRLQPYVNRPDREMLPADQDPLGRIGAAFKSADKPDPIRYVDKLIAVSDRWLDMATGALDPDPG